jgi:vacuolar protein sorting-associated protein 35
LSIQDITALLVSLVNLSLSCYPERLEYVGQVLEFAAQKTSEYQDSPDLHHPATTSNLLSLLLAPINSYPTVLSLLSLPYYEDLLRIQPFSTRRSIAHAVVSSVLKNETIISTPEHVGAVLELCHVLVRDQRDAGVGMPSRPSASRTMSSRTQVNMIDSEEVAEEQGWIARMVHLFYAEDLDTQFALLQAARQVFQSPETGERIKYTLPPLIASAIHLTRRFKYREHFMQDFDKKLDQLFRFIHQVTSQLYNKVDSSSEICLRLNLLALQAADDAKVEGLAYEFAVQVGRSSTCPKD